MLNHALGARDNRRGGWDAVLPESLQRLRTCLCFFFGIAISVMLFASCRSTGPLDVAISPPISIQTTNLFSITNSTTVQGTLTNQYLIATTNFFLTTNQFSFTFTSPPLATCTAGVFEISGCVTNVGGGSKDPAWLQIADGIQKAFTALGVLVGGIWTYYKFVKGRIRKPRLDITVSGTLILIDQQEYLKIAVKVKNVGLTNVKIENTTSIEVSTLDYYPPPFVRNARWVSQITLPLLTAHSRIEPGEPVEDVFLVSLRDKEAKALKIDAAIYGLKPRTVWNAATIVDRRTQTLSHVENETTLKPMNPTAMEKEHANGPK